MYSPVPVLLQVRIKNSSSCCSKASHIHSGPPFPPHEPMEYGIFVGQIIEANGKPRMNTDVRWEYELRGLPYE